MVSKVEWYWQDFNYRGGASKMDSRRAAFWLFDFINEFNIDNFQVIQRDGEWQNASISIVYRMPDGLDEDKIYERWNEFQEKWVETH